MKDKGFVENEESEERDERPASEISDFVDLINCISTYYYYNSDESEDLDSGDEWKKSAGIVNSKNPVPNKIDKLVERAFVVHLKKFLK